MAKFAKLFETAHGQLLATIEGVGDEFDGPTICLRGESDKGVEPAFRAGPFTDTDAGWAEAEAFLDRIDQEDAENIARNLSSTLSNFMRSVEDEQVAGQVG
jgi:mono/diheme cytochrome c family protein